MATKLVGILERCGTSSLTGLLGASAIELLEIKRPEAKTPLGLAEFVVGIFGAEGALKRDDVRKLLFEQMNSSEAAELCELLELPAGAPQLTLRAVAFDRPFYTDLLFRWFGLAYDGSDQVEQESSSKAPSSNKLREHQANAFRELRNRLADSSQVVLVHMPPGAGKLRLVAAAALDLFRSAAADSIVVWIAPHPALCDEAFLELTHVWHDLGLVDVTAYRLYGNHALPDLATLSSGIVIADLDRVAADGQNLASLGARACVVVMNDAEHLGHPIGASLLQEMRKGGQFSIAAIYSASGATLRQSSYATGVMDALTGRSICMVDQAPQLLVAAGDIDPFDVTTKFSPVTGLTVDAAQLDLHQDLADALASDVGRNAMLIELMEELNRANEKVVLQATTADHANLLNGMLGFLGIKAMAITGQMAWNDRVVQMQRFNSRLDTTVLCVHGVFVPGHVVPDVTCLVLARPTSSSAVLSEMVGRTASGRKKPDKPLRVLAIADPVPAFLRLVEDLSRWNRFENEEKQ
ncbi:DEAD/DEAH box helicase family protein [Mesorhizobium sp. M0306]|uniref:DEAD/DEAH box helicase n=1 Tax=unclassified Mesorhizobium TaxID=325217 RepID=UPI00333A4599